MAETPDVRTARLQVDDPLGPRVVLIDKPVFRIGRKSESDLRSVGTDVSREHAEIVRLDDGRFVLKDRGSRCGTFVNDEQVTERSLRHRDRIRLGRSGSAEMVFLADDGADSRLSHSSGLVDLPAADDAARSAARARLGARARRSAGARDGLGHRRDRRRARVHHARQPERRARVQDRARARQGDAVGQVVRDQPEDSAGGLRHRPRADRRRPAGRAISPASISAPSRSASATSSARRCASSGISNDRPRQADQRPIGVLYLDSREKGQLMSAGGAQRARSGCRRSRLGDRERAAVSRGHREGAARTRAAARRRDSARAAARGAAVGRRTSTWRRVVDPVPIDRRRLLRLFQPRRTASSRSRSATWRARDRRPRC